MKRGTSNHPKVYELAEALKVKRPTALGYLQLLWDFASEYAPAGDVGRYSDARIEAALDWGGTRGKLVAALVHSKWLDVDDRSRLVIHDWLEHAEKSVHRRLERASERNHRDARKVTPQNGVTDAKNESPLRAGVRGNGLGNGNGKGSSFGEESLRETPFREVALVPVVDADDGFDSYVGIFLAAGKPVNNTDLEKTCRIWVGMEVSERKLAMADALVRCRSSGDANFIPLPQNHLASKPWTRRAPNRVLPVSNPPARSEMAHQRAAKRFEQRRVTG